MRDTKCWAVAVLGLALGFSPCPTFASDHVDGDVTKGHPIGDLTDLYAFPTPGKPGYLTLVLNVHPFAKEKNHFSEKVDYNFILREAVANPKQRRAETDPSSERMIHCTFDSRSEPHTMTCTAGSMGRKVVFTRTDSSLDGGLRVFAGHRADSFFFNAPWAGITAAKGMIAPDAVGGSNSMESLNTLSIVIDVDVNELFGKEVSLLALVAESVDVKTGARLDRVGRPEVTNVTMVAHEGDTDLRDGYNTKTPFELSDDARRDYQTRIIKNIGYYDALDGQTNWTSAESKVYADLVTDDYLLVDLSKPSSSEGYFAIESALIEGREHTTSGGRLLTDDIMDTLFTILINNRQGERISDGANTPAVAPSSEFPYLGKPNFRLPARLKADVVRKLSGVPADAYTNHEDEHPKKGLLERIDLFGIIKRIRGHRSQPTQQQDHR